ncbi:unnamed protein product, partial [Discosporangium mesarthrocarpum]
MPPLPTAPELEEQEPGWGEQEGGAKEVDGKATSSAQEPSPLAREPSPEVTVGEVRMMEGSALEASNGSGCAPAPPGPGVVSTNPGSVGVQDDGRRGDQGRGRCGEADVEVEDRGKPEGRSSIAHVPGPTLDS